MRQEFVDVKNARDIRKNVLKRLGVLIKSKGNINPRQKKNKPYSAGRKKSISTTKKIILNEEQTLLKTQLCKIGKTVYHTRYGKGEVISYSEIQIAVLFDIGEKILDLDTVVYNGYLSLSD